MNIIEGYEYANSDVTDSQYFFISNFLIFNL